MINYRVLIKLACLASIPFTFAISRVLRFTAERETINENTSNLKEDMLWIKKKMLFK